MCGASGSQGLPCVIMCSVVVLQVLSSDFQHWFFLCRRSVRREEHVGESC